MRKYLHLIDGGGRDYHESVDLLQLKEDVMTKIRDIGEVGAHTAPPLPPPLLRVPATLLLTSTHLCFQMEGRLDDLDVKIGLLIKNMIELDDVVDQAKSVSDLQERGSKVDQGSGLKALKKVCSVRME